MIQYNINRILKQSLNETVFKWYCCLDYMTKWKTNQCMKKDTELILIHISQYHYHAFWLNSLRYNNANLRLHDNCNSHLILITSSSPYWLIQIFNWFIDIGTRFRFLLYPLVSIWLIDTIINFISTFIQFERYYYRYTNLRR